MIGILIRRTLYLIPVLLGGSAIVFTLISPGDPIDALMGVYAA
jgi:ABC-type dipeptide/oligopeptide/nickel transport system permease component